MITKKKAMETIPFENKEMDLSSKIVLRQNMFVGMDNFKDGNLY
jgi:hypothetical protein